MDQQVPAWAKYLVDVAVVVSATVALITGHLDSKEWFAAVGLVGGAFLALRQGGGGNGPVKPPPTSGVLAIAGGLASLVGKAKGAV